MGEGFGSKYRYEYGSTARAYYEAIPTSPSRLPEQRPRPQVRPRTQPKTDRALVVKLSVCGFFVFTCTFMYVHLYSTLATAQAELKLVKNEIRETRSSISYTQSQISEKLNLDYIRQRASKELNMAEPLPHQIVYIELPEQSHTLYNK